MSSNVALEEKDLGFDSCCSWIPSRSEDCRVLAEVFRNARETQNPTVHTLPKVAGR